MFPGHQEKGKVKIKSSQVAGLVSGYGGGAFGNGKLELGLSALARRQLDSCDDLPCLGSPAKQKNITRALG